jgi:hypothetical protein
MVCAKKIQKGANIMINSISNNINLSVWEDEDRITETSQDTSLKTKKIKLGKEQARKLIMKVIDLCEKSIKEEVVPIKGISIKRNLLYFSLLVLNDPDLQEELKAETNKDKDKFLECLIELGKRNNRQFTEQDVKAIPGTWEAQSAKELLATFLDLPKVLKGSLEQFLTTVKNNSSLQDKLMEAFLDEETESLEQFAKAVQNNPALQKKLRTTPNKDSFVKQAVDLGKQNGYVFTDKKVQAISGSWNAQSVQELLEVFLKVTKGSLENLIDKETAQRQFKERAMELAQENGYILSETEGNRLSKALADAWTTRYERGRIWS